MSHPGLESLPQGIRTALDYRPHAQQRLSPQAWAYVEDHAGEGFTRAENRAAWRRVSLLPRVLRAVDRVDPRVQLLGREAPLPVLVAPMALQRLAHTDGELGMALAAATQGAGLVVSMQTSVPLERIAAAVREESGRGPVWFQLYLLQDRPATLELVRQAEACGYEALVLTVDAAVRATRPLTLPPDVRAVHVDGLAFHAAPGWDDVAWLLSETRLPVLLKGVLHPEDAREAARMGVAGLIVSNHGGRVLDGAAASAAALPAIADAVGSELPLLVDGGIATGADVLRAMALGARGVLLGRPAWYGLATAGAAGAAHVLRLIGDELRLTMAQCGLRDLNGSTAGLLA